jgi:hypothetical protein
MAAERAVDGCWSINGAAAGDTLLMKFVGTTPTHEFRAFLAELAARMPDTPATLIFDLTELDGHNPETKEPMKDWLLRHKLAIREVVVVVPKSKMILKLVTAAIGVAVGVKITVREAVPPPESSGSLATF